MTQLIEATMPNFRRWELQAARIISHFLAFTYIYLPGWITVALIAKFGLYTKTSVGIMLINFILAGLATTSFAILCGTFYRKSQLSGITSSIIGILLSIAAQVSCKYSSSATVAILSLLFTPMTYVYSMILMARWETQLLPANLTKSAPQNPWGLPGIVVWVAFIIQIFVYPVLGAIVERWLYGTASKKRIVSWKQELPVPVQLTNFSKSYAPNRLIWILSRPIGWKLESVVAVDNLTLSALKGQIMVLVGPNGCGKTTTLEAIAGIGGITSGNITLDGTGGIGICPQKVMR